MTLFGFSLLTALLAAEDAYEATPEPVVAAVAYTGNPASDAGLDCVDLATDESDVDQELCEVEVLVRSAVDQGAQLIVVSEGAFEAVSYTHLTLPTIYSV